MRLTVVDQNIQILGQGRDLLRSLRNEDYTRTGPKGESGVGPHFRHTIEFYRALLSGLEHDEIDYDGRERDEAVSADRSVAVAALESLLARFEEECLDVDPGQPVRVRVDAPAGADPRQVWSRSTLLREMQFVLSHTVHHYALIARQLRDRGIEPGTDFGVAPATLAHRQDREHCLGS